LNVVIQGGDALGDRPDPIQPQGIDRQAPKHVEDLDAVDLPVRWASSLNGTSRTQCQLFTIEQRCRMALSRALALVRKLETSQRVLSCGLPSRVPWLRTAMIVALPGHRSLLHDPLQCRHDPERPGDVTAPFDFPLAGAPGEPPAVGEPISDQAKPVAATVFDGDQEVRAALGEVKEKGLFACSAPACTSTPSSCTGSRRWRRAWSSQLTDMGAVGGLVDRHAQ
jgi:hypothetical protein